MIYHLSLGSNLGTRLKNLETALHLLQRYGRVIQFSACYETSPVNMNDTATLFYNMAISFQSPFTPEQLMRNIQCIENEMGRGKDQHGGRSRIIDIDILLAGAMVVQTDIVTIPHPRMIQRAFVMIPLHDIAPGIKHPVLKKTIRELVASLKSRETIVRLPQRAIVTPGPR